MKGLKFLLLLLYVSAWIPVRAESYPEAESSADPDYVYVKKNKDHAKTTESGVSDSTLNKSLRVTYPEVKVSEDVIIEEFSAEIPVVTEEVVSHELTVEESKENSSNGPEKLEEFKRDIESVEFVPKGQWIFGLSVSYTQSSQNKYQFLILENISGDTYSFKISPMVLFTVKADLALGGRFSYARSLTKVANADIILDSETDYTFDHLYRLSHNYYGAALMRNYFSIGKSRRFGFFNEVSLQMGGGQTKLTTGVGDDLTGTYERNFSLNVGLTPGLCIFLSNYSALEVNVGLLGFNYTETKAVKDQIYVSHRNYKSANFRINLFSITFGATFYI